jgi:hypothetical protein
MVGEWVLANFAGFQNVNEQSKLKKLTLLVN